MQEPLDLNISCIPHVVEEVNDQYVNSLYIAQRDLSDEQQRLLAAPIVQEEHDNGQQKKPINNNNDFDHRLRLCTKDRFGYGGICFYFKKKPDHMDTHTHLSGAWFDHLQPHSNEWSYDQALLKDHHIKHLSYLLSNYTEEELQDQFSQPKECAKPNTLPNSVQPLRQLLGKLSPYCQISLDNLLIQHQKNTDLLEYSVVFILRPPYALWRQSLREIVQQPATTLPQKILKSGGAFVLKIAKKMDYFGTEEFAQKMDEWNESAKIGAQQSREFTRRHNDYLKKRAIYLEQQEINRKYYSSAGTGGYISSDGGGISPKWAVGLAIGLAGTAAISMAAVPYVVDKVPAPAAAAAPYIAFCRLLGLPMQCDMVITFASVAGAEASTWLTDYVQNTDMIMHISHPNMDIVMGLGIFDIQPLDPKTLQISRQQQGRNVVQLLQHVHNFEAFIRAFANDEELYNYFGGFKAVQINEQRSDDQLRRQGWRNLTLLKRAMVMIYPKKLTQVFKAWEWNNGKLPRIRGGLYRFGNYILTINPNGFWCRYVGANIGILLALLVFYLLRKKGKVVESLPVAIATGAAAFAKSFLPSSPTAYATKKPPEKGSKNGGWILLLVLLLFTTGIFWWRRKK